jgi:hypothetical protein
MFKLKTVAPDEPLANDPYYAWLCANADKRGASWIDTLMPYLESLGFVKGQDKINPDQLKTLEHVFDTWARCSPYFPPCKFEELFEAGKRYYIYGAKPSHANATPKLLSMVRDAGWIYEPDPENLYFQIIENRLYAKAQQILASRFLCVLED